MANKVEIIITGNNVYAVNAIDGTKKKLGTLDKKAKMTSKSIMSSFKMMSGAVAGFLSVGGLIMFGKQAIRMALEVEGVRKAFVRLSDAPRLLQRLRMATKNTVTDLHLMQLALRATNFRIPLNVLIKGLEFAKIRATETGESIDYMVNSLVTGLGRQSVKIIDNLGISALEVRKEMEKTGDFIIAVGNIMDRELTKMDREFLSSKDKVEQINTAFKMFTTEIGQDLVTAVGEGSSSLTSFIDLATKLNKLLRETTGEGIIGTTLSATYTVLLGQANWLKVIFSSLWDDFIGQQKNMERLDKAATEMISKYGNFWEKQSAQYVRITGQQSQQLSLTEEQIAAAKRLGDQWTGISTTLKKDVMLSGLSPQYVKLIKLNMKAEEYRQKFGSISGALAQINNWYDTLIIKATNLNNIKPRGPESNFEPGKLQPTNLIDMSIIDAQNEAIKAGIADVTNSELTSLYLRKMATQDVFGAMSSMAQGFYAASGREGRAWFEWYRGLMIAQTLISTFTGAQEAFKTVTAVAGPIAGYAAAAAAVAYGLGNVARISSLQPGGGITGVAGPLIAGGGYTNNAQTTNNNNSGQYYFNINIVGGDNITDFDKDKLARELMESLRKAQGDGA